MNPVYKVLNIEAARELVKTYRSLSLDILNGAYKESINDISCEDIFGAITPSYVLNKITGFGSMGTCTLCKEIRVLSIIPFSTNLDHATEICNYCIWSYPDRKEQFHIPCMYDNNGDICNSTYYQIKEAQTMEELHECLVERASILEKLIERYEKDVEEVSLWD